MMGADEEREGYVIMIDTEKVISDIKEEKLIAIVRGMPEEKLIPVADALYEGGIRLMECTFDHARPDCVAANYRMIAMLSARFAGRMTVGAGTVLTTEEVAATLSAGGEFVISPNVKEAVIRHTREAGAVSMPGALTPTEIVSAWEAGAHFVKLFPAGDMGPSYMKSVRAPLKHIPMLAVGGITPENIPDYLAAGAAGFGVGSPLFPKAAVETGDFVRIAARAEEFVRAVKRAGSGSPV